MMTTPTLALSSFALLAVGYVQGAVNGTAGPWSIETVVGVSMLLVVGMFLWYLRWQKKLDGDERIEQRKDFREALDRILMHDRENHEQMLGAMRDLQEQQGRVADRLAQISAPR